jgi:hypothetical protein
MSCFIFGDSIAVGLAAVLGCASNAQVGLPSSAIVQRAPFAYYDLVVISAGTNDPFNARLPRNLTMMREYVRAGHVVWIRPVKSQAAAVVERTASRYGDAVVGFIPGRDGVHPKSYHGLAASVLKVVKLKPVELK